MSIQVLASHVDASATLQLKMLSFQNPGGRDSDGDDCDFWSDCDPYFQFALDRGNRCAPTFNH